MEILLAILIIAIAIFGLAVGVIFTHKPLHGSCGGYGGKMVIGGVEVACPNCGGDSSKCENKDV